MNEHAAERRKRPGEDLFDAALGQIHTTSPYWRTELASHASMAAEALVELGQSERIPDFVASYSRNLEAFEPRSPCEIEHWRALLGRREQFSQLLAHFEAWLDRAGVPLVVAEAIPHLMPGVLAASLHGLLRVAHGLRAWSHAHTDERRRELAFGLAHWAAEFTPLAGELGTSPTTGHTAVEVLRRLTPLDPGLRVDGIISTRAKVCGEFPTFLKEISTVDLASNTVDDTITSLCGLAAQLLLGSSNARVRFAYLHAITATNALREVIRHLGDAGGRSALSHHWHAFAAVHCMNAAAEQAEPGNAASSNAPPNAPDVVDQDELVRRAVSRLDDHAIKIASAAICEHRRTGDQQLLRAAWSYAAQ